MTVRAHPKRRRARGTCWVAIAVISWGGHAVGATPGERAIVRDTLPAYAQPMSSGGEAITMLKGGTVVTIDLKISGPTGDWCHLMDEKGTTALGFVPCVALARGSETVGVQAPATETPTSATKPATPASPEPPKSVSQVPSVPQPPTPPMVGTRSDGQIPPQPSVAAPVTQTTPAADRVATIPPLAERFTLSVSGGIQAFDYKENFGSVKNDYHSFGPAWGVAASFRVAEQWRLNADYLGSAIRQDTETWDRGSIFGFPITQKDDLKVNFHVVDADLSYSVLKIPEIEWAIAAGWHYYHQGFERSNFRLEVANLVFPAGIQPVTEDVDGFGVKVGTTLEWRSSPRFIASTGVSGYYLYDVSVDNSVLGRFHSQGWAARWKFGLDYLLSTNASIGLGYQGHYITVDKDRNAVAILPDNRTLAHTLLLRLGLRF